jgi:hypothetical protein
VDLAQSQLIESIILLVAIQLSKPKLEILEGRFMSGMEGEREEEGSCMS